MGDNSTGIPVDPSVEDGESSPDHRLVTFFIPLPVPLRIPHGSVFAFTRSEIVDWLADHIMVPVEDSPWAAQMSKEEPANFVSLRIWRPLESQPWRLSPLDNVSKVLEVVTGHKPKDTGSVPRPDPPEVGMVVIEAVTPLLESEDEQDPNPLSAAFDCCLEEINVLIAAYFIASGDSQVERVSRQNLFPFILWASRPLGGQ